VYQSKVVSPKYNNALSMVVPNTNTYFYKKSKYLTAVQWKHINMILNNTNSSYDVKQKVKNIIYYYYEDWAFSKVYHIKKKYYSICKHIQLDELKLYAYIGLRKAIIHYDKQTEIIYNFSDYAYNYVYNEIVYGITELLPLYLYYENQKHIHQYYRQVKNKHFINILNKVKNKK
jgi:hypothetical protein